MECETELACTPGDAKRGQDSWQRRKVRLVVLLYPFVAAAMAINIFLFALLGQALGLVALSPVASLVLGALAGFPATWLAARWVSALIDRADQ